MHRPSLVQLARSARFGFVAAPAVCAAAGLLAVAAAVGSVAAATAVPSAPSTVSVDLPAGAAGDYQVDTVHSTVGFKVKHMDVAYQLGRFNRFTGEVKLAAEAGQSSVVITIDADSIDTNDEGRDKHLRSADFLNSKQFPEAKFTSSRVAAKDADTFTVSGELELHGVKKPVSFDMDLVGARDTGERGGYKAGFFGTLTIDRREFGITTYPKEAIGDNIELTFAIEANKRK